MKLLDDDQLMASYVYERYGFRRIVHIPKSVALGLLNESVYLRDFYSDKLTRLDKGTIVGFENKHGFKSNYPRLWIYRHDRYYWLAEAPRDECLEDTAGYHQYDCRNCGRVTE